MTEIQTKIRVAFILPQLLGFFNLTYNTAKQKFVRSKFLAIHDMCILCVINCFVPAIILLYCLLKSVLAIHLAKDEKFYIQERVISFLNTFQMCFGIVTTYWNHALNKSDLHYILNALLRCDRKLKALTKKDTPSQGGSKILKMRILSTVLDVYLTANRSAMFDFVLLEVKMFVIVNKLIVMSLFLEWHCIQSQLANMYESLNDFVKSDAGATNEKDYQAISKICTRIFKVKRASNKYYGQFAMASFINLMRSVMLLYESFATLLFAPYKNKEPLAIFITVFRLMAVSGIAPFVDIMLLGIKGECLTTQAEKFRTTLLIRECKSCKSPGVQRIIDTILRQALWEDLNWVMTTGQYVIRGHAFQLMIEAICWIITLLMYQQKSLLVFLYVFNDTNEQSFVLFPIIFIGLISLTCRCLKRVWK